MWRLLTSAVAALGALSCAAVESSVHVTGAPGRPTRRAVPVYYALAPPFPYVEVGQLHVTARAERAHLEELVAEAELRAGELGADAIIVDEIRTDTRYVSQTISRTCSLPGAGGRAMLQSCPDQVNTLLVEAHLIASAVRRRVRSEPSRERSPWPLPPRLDPSEVVPDAAVTLPPPPDEEGALAAP